MHYLEKLRFPHNEKLKNVRMAYNMKHLMGSSARHKIEKGNHEEKE